MPIVNPLPFVFTNGTIIDAVQVNADFNQIVANVNSNAGTNGVNSNITQITGLTTPLSVPQGGTGATSFPLNAILIGNGTGPIAVASSTTLQAPLAWTPGDASGAGLAFVSVLGNYSITNNLVHAYASLTYPVNGNANFAAIGSLPDPSGTQVYGNQQFWVFTPGDPGNLYVGNLLAGQTSFLIRAVTGGSAGALLPNSHFSGLQVTFMAIYPLS